jgi:hypothetical protein
MSMTRRALPLWLCLVTSCATARTTGSFVAHPAPSAMREIAVDAARQVGLLYPPAHTQLSFAHATDDDFGRPLVTALRSLGFAVAESSPRGSRLELAYVVDDVDPLYRVVIRVASAHRRISLARAYTHRADALRAAGVWTQQVAAP